MKRKQKLVLPGLVLMLMFIVSVKGFAQTKLAYLNSQKILESFAPAQDAQKKLEAENTLWGQDMQKMNDQLKQLQEQLEQQSLLLSEAKKREKAQEIQNLAIKAQQYQQEKWGEQGEFFKRRDELMKPIIDQINLVINKIGQESNYDFIFDTISANILYAPPKYDLTETVIARLAKEIPAATKSTPGGK